MTLSTINILTSDDLVMENAFAEIPHADAWDADTWGADDLANTTGGHAPAPRDPLSAERPRRAARSAPAETTSLAQFCEFVDYYTRHTTNPLATSVVCEQQAETLRLTAQDVTPETIQMLIDTLLDVIDHLEKKWLDEQIQREDLEQVHRLQVGQTQTNVFARNQKTPQKQQQTGVWHLCRAGARWIWNQIVRGQSVSQPIPSSQRQLVSHKSVSQREVVA